MLDLDSLIAIDDAVDLMVRMDRFDPDCYMKLCVHRCECTEWCHILLTFRRLWSMIALDRMSALDHVSSGPWSWRC
jgi:hypothetical protein